MSSDKIRNKKIECIRKLIVQYRTMEQQWIAEEKLKGNDPDKDIAVRVVRMLLAVNYQWLASEKELRGLEAQFVKIIKTEGKDNRKKGAISVRQ